MKRVLKPELLDQLPANDPRAIQSRRDLRRLNTIMGNAPNICEFLAGVPLKSPLTVVEIGAGDGNIAFQVARWLRERNATGRIILVDQQPVIAPEKIDGWKTQTVCADVFDWLKRAERADIIIANLFLHHFEDRELRRLLAACAERCRCFVAAEPERNRFNAVLAARVKWIGCNSVTQHDAVISVGAGFKGKELSALWPAGGWALSEKHAGLFTHRFGAFRP